MAFPNRVRWEIVLGRGKMVKLQRVDHWEEWIPYHSWRSRPTISPPFPSIPLSSSPLRLPDSIMLRNLPPLSSTQLRLFLFLDSQAILDSWFASLLIFLFQLKSMMMSTALQFLFQFWLKFGVRNWNIQLIIFLMGGLLSICTVRQYYCFSCLISVCWNACCCVNVYSVVIWFIIIGFADDLGVTMLEVHDTLWFTYECFHVSFSFSFTGTSCLLFSWFLETVLVSVY